MIDLDLAELAAWSVGIPMILVVLMSAMSRWSQRNAEKEAVRKRVSCRLCLMVVEDEERGRIFRCPHCGADNERGRNRSLG